MSAQLELSIVHEDIQRLGYIERRPVPGRTVGHPVGHDDRGMPIYRPVWADYEWFATWVEAAEIETARLLRSLRFTHMALCGTDDDLRDPTTPGCIDYRDSYATMRDLWDHYRSAS